MWTTAYKETKTTGTQLRPRLWSQPIRLKLLGLSPWQTMLQAVLRHSFILHSHKTGCRTPLPPLSSYIIFFPSFLCSDSSLWFFYFFSEAMPWSTDVQRFGDLMQQLAHLSDGSGTLYLCKLLLFICVTLLAAPCYLAEMENTRVKYCEVFYAWKYSEKFLGLQCFHSSSPRNDPLLVQQRSLAPKDDQACSRLEEETQERVYHFTTR